VTAPRIVVEGATYAVTRRCAFRKLFLTPVTPVVHEGILYALALAQHKARVRLHGDVVMPNHVHLAVTPTEDNLPDFLRLFFGETGKLLKVALAEHGFEPPERVWNADRPHVMRLVDEGAQLSWLHYVAANPVDAGLVDEVARYPGRVSDPGLLRHGRVKVRRPPFYFDARTCPDELTLHYSPPPLLERSFGSVEPVVYHLRRAITETERACKRRGAPVLGPTRIARQHPWAEPRSPRTFRPGPVPSFMVTGSRALKVQCAQETTAFRQRYEGCRRARMAGEDPEFPYGTYALRVFHRVRVEDPHCVEGALVNAPGELGCEAPPVPKATLRALTSALRQAAGEASEAGDTLAERILEGQADQVDRRAGPDAVSVPPVNGGPAADAGATDASPDPKRVVLRNSTAAARKRRWDNRPVAGSHKVEVDPPPE
jgi:REP element-mobilizing transposase RayT